jgi:uncharacterized protein YbaR (Trm112 family)
LYGLALGERTVVSEELLKLLVCPEDHTPLQPAPAELIEMANRKVGAGTLRNRLGRVVERHLDGGLIRADGKYLYQVVDDLPIMLIDEAVPLDQLQIG